MRKTARLFLLSPLLLLFLLPSVGRADTLTFTSGSVNVPGSGFTFSFSFKGQGASFSGTGEDSSSPGPRSACLGFCGNNTLSLSSTFADLNTGDAVINGTTYHVQYGGELLFVSSTVTIPPGSTSPLTFTAPFTLSGTLAGLDPTTQATLFSYSVSGQGLATLQLIYNPINGRYEFGSLTYTFTSTPTPEPATLALLGTGLAGAFARARRRRRAVADSDHAL